MVNLVFTFNLTTPNQFRSSNLTQFSLQSMTVYEHDLGLYLDTALADTYFPRQELLESLFCAITSIVCNAFHASLTFTHVITRSFKASGQSKVPLNLQYNPLVILESSSTPSYRGYRGRTAHHKSS
jgi:hypothetical protein